MKPDVQVSRRSDVGTYSPLLILCALTALAWRILTQPLSFLWRDWIMVLALYLFFSGLRIQPRARTQVALYLMIYLFGIYFMGQAPWIFRSWVGFQ